MAASCADAATQHYELRGAVNLIMITSVLKWSLGLLQTKERDVGKM